MKHSKTAYIVWNKKEIILAKGYSGVGKSTVIDTLQESVSAIEKGIFVRGKYDSYNQYEPYSGIAAAFGNICRAISEMSIRNEVGDEIVSALGKKIEVLYQLIPEFYMIVFRGNQVAERENNMNFAAKLDSFKFAFRVLTRALCSHFSVVCIALDDLQWANEASLQAINYLISDSQNPNAFMVVGSYRSNEIDETHPLSDMIKVLIQGADNAEFNVTNIDIGSLGVDQVNRIIMAALAIDYEQYTEGLSEVCFKRTLGNPYFVIQFLKYFEAGDLISFNPGLLKLLWDETEIENETMATLNVVDLLQARMKKLSSDAQLLLQYAACLGSPFRTPILSLIWTKNGNNSETLPDLLAVLEEHNVIESCGDDKYRWLHDKVQEAALSFGDAAKPSFQFETGVVLYQGLNEDQLDECLFDVVNLINKKSVKRRDDFAVLNLKAAKKAVGMSAFRSASSFIANGIGFLPSDKWSRPEYRYITLRLYALGAQTELAVGRVGTMELYFQEIFSKGECSTLEKPAHCQKFSDKQLKVEACTTIQGARCRFWGC